MLKLNKYIFISVLILIYPFIVAAEDVSTYNRHASPEVVFEYSLSNLNQKALTMAERNQWLDQEIYNIQNQIVSISQELKSMEGEHDVLILKRDRLQVVFDIQDKKEEFSEKNSFQAHRNAAYLNEEQDQLEQTLQAKIEQQNNLKETLRSAEFKVNEFQQEITHLDSQLEVKPFELQKRELLNSKIKNEKSLKIAEEKYQDLKKKYHKPGVLHEKLNEDKILLQRDTDLLEDEMSNLKKEAEFLQAEIGSLSGKNENQLKALNEEINRLKTRKNELALILGQVKNKIQDKNIIFDNVVVEKEQLEENFQAMQKENKDLKEEMTKLEKIGSNI